MTFDRYALGEACSFIDYRGKTPKKATSGIPLITAKIVKNGFISKPDEFIADEDYDSWMRRGVPRKGSVIMTTEAPLGEVARIPSDDRFAFAQRIIVLEPRQEILDAGFLYYALRDSVLMGRIKSRATGTTVTGIKAAELKKVEIDCPPIETQKRVASLLSSLDQRIENNESINDNLMQQALGIFAQMFTAPESTVPATIADVALNVTDGVHNTVHDDPNGQYLLLSCKNIKGGSLSISQCERRISQETFEKLRRRTKLAKGDVLISSVGTVGELLMLNTDPANYEFQRSVAIIKPNPEMISSSYLYLALMMQRAELINAAHGAVQQCLFISDISEFPIGIPNAEILRTFNSIVTPMFNKMSENEAENERLSQIRDTLLPCLMSGEIDVSNINI